MKLKYYLRGVGTGILFATIILFISYSYKMSDSQIKKRAEELGMVMDTEEQSSSNVADNQTSGNEQSSGEEQTSGNEQPSGEEQTSGNEQPSGEEQTSGNEQPSGEEQTSEQPSEEESSTEESTTKEHSTNIDEVITCTIKVTNQTGSHHVARQLKQAGIIDNADDFNNYLINNGYAYKIQNGTFTFTKGMTYEEMARYLTTGRKPN